MDSYSPSSSSSLSLASKIKFDVFLSFRGTDTRKSFVSHLYKALCRDKVETFIDYKLREGNEISPALLTAIEQSQISLVIFSEDYASSRWCLEELEKIIECKNTKGQIVVPIFYKIQPSDVRSQKGIFGDGFAQLRERYKNHMNKVEKWRAAMNEAANLSGFTSSINYRSEADLIEEIVKRVLSRLNHMYQFNVQDPVGIDEHITCVEYLMCKGLEDVRLIGIWGMGGIGKTTIAGVMFNRLSSEYEGYCFLQVREEMEKHGITHMQNKLVSMLLEEDLNLITTPNILPTYVMRRLSRKKVLVILDDVNDPEVLRNLVGGLDWFGPGSRIIVTTRDKQVLGNKDAYIYEVRALSSDKAIQLFYLNAFKQNCVDTELIELSQKFVTYANGVPLALKVLGSFLHNKSKEEWESQWEKLNKMPFQNIQSVLRLSYRGLDREEKKILKYIACFFGRVVKKDQIKVVLDSCGYSTVIGLKNLHDKSLIIVYRDCLQENIFMHELIQEMVKEIVREESIEDSRKRNHLWDTDDIHQVLQNNKGTNAIESITLDQSKVKRLSLHSQAFTKMPNLKLLKFYTSENERSNLDAPQGLESLPDELRMFCWEGYPLKSLPLTSYCVENLVEISMVDSELEKLWDGVQEIVNLRSLDLGGCEHLIELPDCSKAPNLQDVNLYSCSALRYVHPSILSHHKLEYLEVSGCKALESLRSDVHLLSLKSLFAHGCSSLREFSITSEKMKYLDLMGTAIEELRTSNRQLSCLEHLWVGGSQIWNLSNDLASLSSLEIYESAIVNRSTLYVLFNDGLRSLQKLILVRCCNLNELPDNISLLSSLTQLSLIEANIESLPKSMKNLLQLKTLHIKDCKRLQSLLELPSFIEHLTVCNCTSLKTVSIFMSELLNGQKKWRRDIVFSFANCVKLNEQALEDISAYAHVRIKQVAFEYLSEKKEGESYVEAQVCYPGSNVPNWFSHPTKHATAAIKLPPHSKLMGFILGFIVPPYPDNMMSRWRIGYKFCLIVNNGERIGWEGTRPLFSYLGSNNLTSDHVILWYAGEHSFGKIKEIGKLNEPSNVRTTAYYSMAACEFFIDTKSTFKAEIKECGICPIYASDHPDFIQQFKNWATKTKRHRDFDGFEPSDTGIGVNYILDEQRPLSLTKKLKESIFQSSSSETRGIDEVEQREIETGVESSAYENEDDIEPATN